VWLFRVAQLFGYDFQTILHFADALPESYQQRVYNNTVTTVQCRIQQAENPTPAVVISVEAACVDNAILLDYRPPKWRLRVLRLEALTQKSR
jgi:hypothetical protein